MSRKRTEPSSSGPNAALVLGIAMLLATLLAGSAPAMAQNSGGVHAQIDQAFLAIHAAEADGGNVTSLVSTLNQAINLTEKADSLNSTSPQGAASLYSQAYSLASGVVQGAPAVAAQGRAAVSASTTEFYAETIALAALAVVGYFFTPKLFWRAWLRAHKGWRVQKV
jgi:hypothetical protein